MPEQLSDDELGRDETVAEEPSPLPKIGDFLDPQTQQLLQQGASVAKKLNQHYGADKMIMGGGVALLIAGAALYTTKE